MGRVSQTHTKSVRPWTVLCICPGKSGEKVAGPEGLQRQISQGLMTTGTVRQELWEVLSREVEAGNP